MSSRVGRHRRSPPCIPIAGYSYRVSFEGGVRSHLQYFFHLDALPFVDLVLPRDVVAALAGPLHLEGDLRPVLSSLPCVSLLDDLGDAAGADGTPPSRIAKPDALVHLDRVDELHIHLGVSQASPSSALGN